MLIRLRGCAGWSAPLLFAYGINRFCHDAAHFISILSHRWAYTIGRLLVIVAQSSNSFFPLGQSKPNFMWSLNGIGEGTKVCSNDPGHMTKMAVMHMHGKNTSSLEPTGCWSWNLVYSIRDLGFTKLVQMMILNWPWPLQQGKISPQMFLCRKLLKSVNWKLVHIVN